jgi:RNA polymerase sigma factor (sigma-70 family)
MAARGRASGVSSQPNARTGRHVQTTLGSEVFAIMERSDPGSAIISTLVRRVQQGDVEAQHELYHRFLPLVQRATAPYRRNPWLSDDLRGEAYLLFYALTNHFDPNRRVGFRTYMKRVLPRAIQFIAIKQQKVAFRETAVSGLVPPSGAGERPAGPDELLERWMEHGAVWQQPLSPPEEGVVGGALLDALIGLLPTQQRAVFCLWIEGVSPAEIAATLGISPAACYKACHRARATLRRALEETSTEDVQKPEAP